MGGDVANLSPFWKGKADYTQHASVDCSACGKGKIEFPGRKVPTVIFISPAFFFLLGRNATAQKSIFL